MENQEQDTIDTIYPGLGMEEKLYVPDDLLDPLTITPEEVSAYIDALPDRSTLDATDDLMMIWLCLPEKGYGDRKAMIKELRQVLIDLIRIRPHGPSRFRLEYRLSVRRSLLTSSDPAC